MAPKRNIETPDIKTKPKKTRRLNKKYKTINSDKIEQMVELDKACRNGNLEIVRQILKRNLTLEINQQITPKDIQEKCLLHLASRIGNIEIVEELVNCNIDINYTNNVGHTALHIASWFGHVKVVAILLANGIDVNLRASHKETALHLASDYGHASVVALLLDHGANVYLIEENTEKALTMASTIGHLKVVKELLKFDKEIDVKIQDGRSPLHLASENGHTNIVKELLDNGARIDLHVGSNPEGCNGSNCETYCYPEGNALHLAIQSGKVETVRLLLNRGATLNQKCAPNYFLDACQLGHLEIVKELIKWGASIHEQNNYKYKVSPLHVAIANNNIEVVKELLSQGANVNHEDSYYGTPINITANDGNLILVKELLNYGANPYQTLEGYGHSDYLSEETPLWVALEKGYHSIVEEMLLYAENDAIVVDINDWTPLHYASFHGHKGSVTKLLARGCNPNVLNKDHETPLHFAIDFAPDADSIVKELLNYGANINIKAENGDTAFHKAFASYDIKKNENIIHILMDEKYNYNFNLKNEDGKTVLDIAIEQKNNDVARMIAKRMCPKPKITDSIYPLKNFL